MLKKYQVLATMLAMERFTVSDLHEATGVGKPTIQTILSREKHRYRKVAANLRDIVERPRGAPPELYELRPDAREELAAELESLYKSLPPIPDFEIPARLSTRETEEKIPAELLAAEYTLFEVVPKQPLGIRSRLYRQISDYLRAAEKNINEREVSGADVKEARSRLRNAQVDASLASLERYFQPGHLPGEVPDTVFEPVLVGAVDAFAEPFANRVGGVLAGVLNDHNVRVACVRADELVGRLPKTRRFNPNIVILAIDSADHSPPESISSLVNQSAANSVVVVIDAAENKVLAKNLDGLSARYVCNAADISSPTLLGQLTMAAATSRYRG